MDFLELMTEPCQWGDNDSKYCREGSVWDSETSDYVMKNYWEKKLCPECKGHGRVLKYEVRQLFELAKDQLGG